MDENETERPDYEEYVKETAFKNPMMRAGYCMKLSKGKSGDAFLASVNECIGEYLEEAKE